MKLIKLSEIVIDAGTQQRASINEDVVAEYAESIQCGNKFPCVTLFFDGVNYYLVDGFHRYHAHKISGIAEIEADVKQGTKREAILHSASVNNNHGIRLTNADKRKAVMMLLNDAEWSQWSDRSIANHCKVTHPFVAKLRAEVVTVTTPKDSKVNDEVVTVTTQDEKEVVTVTTDEPEYDETEQENIELRDMVVQLDEENQRLKDAIAVSQLPDDEQQSTSEIIGGLRKQVKSLEAALSSAESARDMLYHKVSELESLNTRYLSKLKQAGLIK